MRRLPVLSAIAAVVALLVAAATGCGHNNRDGSGSDSVNMPDTLRVATLYSPTSFFYFRDQPMGYDYELLSRIAEDHHMPLDWHIAPSLAAAVEWLDSGRVDLIAYDVPVTAQYREHVITCGIENITRQVLVQPRKTDSTFIADVTQLVGRDIYVEADSRYHERIVNLDSELGGGINIHVIDSDTIIGDDLVEMVASGKIPLTIVDSDIARINRTYFPGIDVSVEVSLDQRSAWGVAHGREWLADSINAWTMGETPRKVRAQLLRRYFELAKGEPAAYDLKFENGHMSPYDNLFKKYASASRLDWRMLAAQAYVESRYDPTVVSWAGARGIMQIMPATARSFDVSADSLIDNELSVSIAAKILASLDRSLSSRVPDAHERIDFVLAAYNSGLAHILDAIELAKVTGLNPERWHGNVENALLLKANPEYFNNPVVKYGYFRGRQTTEYVRHVRHIYDKALKEIKK